jgi:NTP pyrophosphatase (non-canonical NTP hydrolase)
MGDRHDLSQACGSVFRDLTQMQTKFGMPKDGTLMTPEFLDFRFKFQLEELIEMDQAINERDAAKLVDALVDQIVVAVGSLNLLGVNSQGAWDEVLRANMAKQRGNNPTRSGSGGVDLIKPAGWEPPNMAQFVVDPLGPPGALLPGIQRAFHGDRTMPHSVSVLLEAINLQLRKSSDYNDGGIQRGDYWIHGLTDFEYVLHQKHLRFRSLISKFRRKATQLFESLEDTLFDKIVYSALTISWLRRKEPGQIKTNDLFNEPEQGQS